jgi:serine/threonine protein kinase/WD40 repeat protein
MSDPKIDAKAIFLEALDCKDADELMRFLEQACRTDAAVRARVEELLRAHQDAGAFLGGPEKQDAARDQPIAEHPGTVIGPYKLLEQIGEGGFGLVFVAEQQQPVRRKVALKILKPGMDSRQVIARFEAERQALALMDHPNIAKVLDAGATETGRPHFVMELVRGVPITDYCDQNRLTTRERLELFAHVCQAVQHAHHKGIIHRDIKPSNVMVTLHDSVPVVKVIDFGIAKALGQQLTDKTLYTGFAQMVGTPTYMSPEQAQLSGLDIDTRSDIYSLGVLLYELLTATTPFDQQRLGKADYDEMRRIIREEEPARPSTRLSTMGEAATVVSARRQSDPKRLSQLFRGELDWIVMKALEKERGRRYETASAFAADIERYLHDEPVAACPPSTWYRFGKFARRHKTGLMSAAVVTLALVAGAGVSIWQAILATQAETSEREALTNLGEEQKATKRELRRTQEAEKKATLELFESLVAQARANRLSRRIGQRFQTLELVERATGMARQLKLPADRFRALRNEAIAALALPDLRVAKEWPEASGYMVHFDAKFERYARTDRHGNVQVRRADDAKVIYRLAGVGPGEANPMLSPDGSYLSVWAAGRVHIWKLAGAEPPPVLNIPALGPPSFSPDSRQLAVQESDGTIGVFDLATSARVRQLPKVARVFEIAFHPSYERLALACLSFAQVRDLQTGEVLWQKNLTDYWYRPVAWHPEGKTLALGDGQAIALWDVAKDEQIGNLEMNNAAGTKFTFNSAGTVLASTGWHGVLRLWDPRTGRQLFSTRTGLQTPAPQFSADGRFLAATHYDQKLCIWEIAAANECRTLIASPLKGKRPYGNVAISPDGRFLAAGAGGAFALWDLPTAKELAFQEGSSFNFVAFEHASPRQGGVDHQEATLLSTGNNGLFRWPIRAEPLTGPVGLGRPQKLPFPALNATIAQSDDGRVRVFSQRFVSSFVQDTDQPDKWIRLEPPHLDVRHIAMSPNGRWVATGRFSYPGGVKIWELDKASTKRLTYKPPKDLPSANLSVPLFSPDGKHLLATAVVGILPIRRWEVETWAEMPFTEPVEGQNPTFSPDGKHLVLETGRGVARIVDADTGREYALLEDADQHYTAHFAFSPDGAKLACASGDGCCIHVWDLQAIRRQLAEMCLDWD